MLCAYPTDNAPQEASMPLSVLRLCPASLPVKSARSLAPLDSPLLVAHKILGASFSLSQAGWGFWH
eukprot:3007175-Rhodomonas_salina.1